MEGVADTLGPADLMQLAQRDDAESRLVMQRAGKWEVRHGPFSGATLRRLPKTGWTLLVQDVNHFVPDVRRLLTRFRFIPHARLDDVMVSYAPSGGGVGPHVDSYDVFLLQGIGRRRWQIAASGDMRLVEDAPLKLLADFRPEQEWILEAGDMLYLPPGYAHDGVAVDACMTFSVGFRAPTWHELAARFLDFLHDELEVDGMYEDPDLKPSRSPGRLPQHLIERSLQALASVCVDRTAITHFLGSHLTEPKPHVFFSPPRPCASRAAFERRARKAGVRLSPRTRMLYSGSHVYVNGERESLPHSIASRIRSLADDGALQMRHDDVVELLDRCHTWYCAGFLELEDAQ